MTTTKRPTKRKRPAAGAGGREYGQCRVTERGKRCREPAIVKKHRLCWPHYNRYRRTGDVGGVEIKRERRELPPFKG